jgi:hypothetical protein
MATFTTYAEVLTSEHPQMKAYVAGIKKNPPGRLIRDVLQDTGGAYEIMLRMSPSFQDKVRNVAELTKDETLRRVASQPEVVVSFEHLRHLDPDTTTIVLGFRLDYAPGEADRLGLRHEGPFDPRNTMYSGPGQQP